jgi:hypothetical protein
MVRGSSKILTSSTTFLTTFEEVMRSHLTVPLSPRHAGRSEAGFAISPHSSCTIIQKTEWSVKIKMGLIQIKLKFIHYFINWLHTNYNRVSGKCQWLRWSQWFDPLNRGAPHSFWKTQAMRMGNGRLWRILCQGLLNTLFLSSSLAHLVHGGGTLL